MIRAVPVSEFAQIATRIGSGLKEKRLRKMPGMDEVAVRINSGLTYAERQGILLILEALPDLGYAIVALTDEPKPPPL